eukprot:TRINITY_DN1048_c0_g1_i2.p1 TRINITY_DN1048_c0_g1~~TRINITY_DN1048_c0_g1_i2.p1  ORF type:complete len:272 (+),score=50.03 TRINITY_DN1048_c0_g1_i2:731-1546(+)
MDLEADDVIELNVSGRLFSVQRSTLTSNDSLSYFTGLLSGRIPVVKDAHDRIFLNRPACAFAVILAFLQTGKWYLPGSPALRRMVMDECDFYGIPIDDDAGHHRSSAALEDEKQWRWNADYCDRDVEITEDGQVVTNCNRFVHRSVIGTTCWRTGVHCWELQLRHINRWVMIGVTTGVPTEPNSSWKWSGNYAVSTMSQVYVRGKAQYQNQFQALSGDVVQVTLNCDEHWLRIVNNTRDCSIQIDNLPTDASYFPHLGLHGASDQIACTSK